MEKRDFTRVPFKTEAIVEWKDRSIRGEVKNLSLKGMLLETAEPVELNQAVHIRILLSGASSELSIKIDGAVVRRDARGTAFEFTGMDLDSFIHLRNIITFNGGDESRIMEEFQKHMKRK